MYHYKARIYSPTLGRFLQADPIGYEDQVNLYAYVGNDPLNDTDPTGRWGLVGKLVKLAIKGGDVAATFAGAVQDIRTITSSKATARQRAGAALSLVTEVVSPVSLRDAKAIVKTVKGTCCFVAGTLVDTETGLRPIESVRVGDRVWSRNESTGETALKKVTDLIQRHERVIWEVTLKGPNGETESFETADDHPWWIAGQGWKRTEELVAGMAVVTRDGRGMLLASVAETIRTAPTYNLTVADFETYFVGKQRVLVHNCTVPKMPPSKVATVDGVTVSHYYKSRDHPPAHMHVKGGGPSTKIGPNGKPIKGSDWCRQVHNRRNSAVMPRSSIACILAIFTIVFISGMCSLDMF